MRNLKIFLGKKNIDVLIILSAIAIVIMLPQIYNHAIILGGDTLFHMNRFYETYQQIKTGNYSYFQSLYGFSGSARIVNALYGPYLAYLMGFLLLILKSWFKFQIVTGFFLLFISGFTMFELARKVLIEKPIALVMSAMYMCTPWVASGSFTAVGASLFPLVVMAGVSMLDDNNSVSIIKLSFLISILVQVHMFTSFLAILVLIPFFLVGLIVNKNKVKLASKVIISAIITIFLTSNVWSSMLEVMGSNELITVFPSEMEKSVMHFSDIKFGLMDYGMYSIVFLFILIRTIILWRKINVLEKTINSVGMFFLLLSTSFVPWRFLEHHFYFLRSFVQFPHRFSVVVFTSLILGFGIVLNDTEMFNKVKFDKYAKIICLTFLSLLVINANGIFESVSQYWNTDKPFSSAAMPLTKSANTIRNAFKNSKNLGSGFNYLAKVNPDYLPSKRKYIADADSYNRLNPYELYYEQISLNKVKLNRHIAKNGKLIVSWDNKGKNKFIQLPIFKYRNSKMYINGKRASNSNIKISKIGAVTAYSHVGDNKLVTEYKSSKLTRLLMLMNYTSWGIFLIAVFFIYLRKIVKHNNK
ncbi:hypothetical protein [Paucilactobacillus kaifaensis]|uniref:hypothetical protein n=1 Tax=Paucilactobacillus kaifaensis TaxID=2559921 RepID=UPI0010F4CDFA|nr:hypothetical protein [Paucilactobacillus kaifaensis]